MASSPEPLIDFNSGSDEDINSVGKHVSLPSPPRTRPPPPPPPSSTKPVSVNRSSSSVQVSSRRVAGVDRPSPPASNRKSLPPSSINVVGKKPSPPPKPKNRHSAIFTSEKTTNVSASSVSKPLPSLPVTKTTVRPLPPPKAKPQQSSPTKSTRASDSPISPVPNNDLIVVRETPTTESDDKQLRINGVGLNEGVLIDFREDETKLRKSMSTSSTDVSKLSRKTTQVVSLPRLSTKEFDYEERQHPRNVFKQLHNLVKKGELCDAVLIAGDNEIKAHRIVLAANSPYFRDMFIGEFSEPEGVPVVIEEVDEDSLTGLIEFAYTSRIKLTQTNVYKLFEAADVLQFQGVKNACFRFFRSQMNKSNCIRTWMFAESHNCTELLEAALKFMEVNFLDIVRGSEFLNIEPETVSKIVSLEDLAITCEEQVYEAVLGWINHDKEARLPMTLEVMQNVRFPSMNKDYLMHIVDNEDVVRNDPECLNLLIQALKSHVPSERATLTRNLKKQGSKYMPRSASMAVEEVELPKGDTSLGVAIMGGSDRPTHVFRQGDKPGIFIREVISGGTAAKSGKLRTGDRILSINGADTSNCPHDAAIRMLLSGKDLLKLLVRHEPPPKGLKEITLVSKPGCGFGFSIGGGVNGEPVNPFDETDEGIFITQIVPGGTCEQDGRLTVGTRILQVNSISLLGRTLDEALKILHVVLDRMTLLVCNGFDPSLSVSNQHLGGSGSIGSEDESAATNSIIYDEPPA